MALAVPALQPFQALPGADRKPSRCGYLRSRSPVARPTAHTFPQTTESYPGSAHISGYAESLDGSPARRAPPASTGLAVKERPSESDHAGSPSGSEPVASSRLVPELAVRELDPAEFFLATEVWRDYHGTWGDPAIDRVFALFANRTPCALAMCRRHPDGYEVDAVFTPAPFRGRGYARRVVAELVEACHHDDLFMYAIAGLEPFYAGFGFCPIPVSELPPTLHRRYDWSVGETEDSRITPMRRYAGRASASR